MLEETRLILTTAQSLVMVEVGIMDFMSVGMEM